MAACEFDFTLPAAPADLRRAIEADFARFGGTLTGEGESGDYALPTPLGAFTGRWRIADAPGGGSSVSIAVDDKPMFIPCSAIEEHLRRRLAKAAAGRY